MANTYYTLLTKIGQASIANAVALNKPVNLTSMAVGDGNGNPTTPSENQTSLVREKFRAQINQLTVDKDNPNYLIAELIIPTTVGGWSIYEVGVFDDQNQLVAVANFPATYKPELAEGSGRDLIVRIVIQVSNTSVVTLKVDPAVILASQAWVAANYVKKTTVGGGTTGQILAKKSNANEDFVWVDPTAAVDVNVFSREETQTVASGQTIVNLAQLTTDGAAVYIEGVRLRDNQFTVNSPTRLTLATTYPNGTKVTVVQNEETSRNAFMLKSNNLADVTDKDGARANLALDRLYQAAQETFIYGNEQRSIWLSVKDDGSWGVFNNATGQFSPLPVGRGGTGANDAATARTNLGLGTVATESTVPVNKGGTGATNAATARTNLGLGSVAIESTVPVTKGGTGATNAATAQANLGLGSVATRNVGTGNGMVPDMSFFTSGATGAKFWQKLPSGVIIQYGYVFDMSSGAITIDYPVPFTTELRSLQITPTGNISSNSLNAAIPSLEPASGSRLLRFSVSGYNLPSSGPLAAANILFYWEAIGV